VGELGEEEFSVIPWYHDDFAGASRYFLDQLIDAPDEQDFDFAIFVLGKDDPTISRDRFYYAPRDNVLFELGIFMGKLGRDHNGRYRTFVLAPKPWKTKLKVLSDFQGYTLHYHDPPAPGKTKAERLANLGTVLKPIILTIKKQMQLSGPRDSYFIEHVSWVPPLLTRYLKGPSEPRVVKNLALDLGATWDIYSAFFRQPDVRNVTILTLMMDGEAEDLINASGTEPPTAERARRTEEMLLTFCQKHGDDLTKRGIRFECRKYSRVPFVHGFLMQGHKLLLTMLLVKDGKMKAISNPYWELDYPTTTSTAKNRTVRHSFEAYELWFDQQWQTARPVWPAAIPES
jgi:hypothetical protein